MAPGSWLLALVSPPRLRPRGGHRLEATQLLQRNAPSSAAFGAGQEGVEEDGVSLHPAPAYEAFLG